jgi:hypothetical protein
LSIHTQRSTHITLSVGFFEYMKCNIGKTERLIRIAAGLLLAVAGIFGGGLWTLLGVAVMVSAFIGWCPVRAALGLSSCREEEKLPVDTSGEHTDRKPQNRLFK